MAAANETCDVLMVGSGVIGLSVAWELAQQDVKVRVVDRGRLGREASWAGAGMIPPGPARSHWPVATPLEQLEGLSEELHARWHETLLEQTGIDNEYRQCGAVHLAFTQDEADLLQAKCERWRQLDIDSTSLDALAMADIEPALSQHQAAVGQACLLPSEAQIRNPRHLDALIAACQQAGVELQPEVCVHDFLTDGQRVTAVRTSDGTIEFEHCCLAAGSWSGELAKSLGLELPIRPIRGQIVLLKGPPGLLKRTIVVGPRYVVPRNDGHVLVGSTQEDVGFVKENTAAGVDALLSFAEQVSPTIAKLPIEAKWSGLRPATADGLPYLGRLPELENGWIATGHFRAGLQLSPATAVVMSCLMLDTQPPVATQLLEAGR